MPSISGSVLYATGRFGSISGTSGIPNIPIVIQNTSSGSGIVVLTNTSGNYTVNNVPAGSYRIVEAYGTTGGVASPADFSTGSSVILNPTPKDPPLSAISAPITGTNQVDSLSPNTLLVTVAAANLTSQNFTDSSVANIPLSLPTGTTLGNNILTLAGNGMWGTLPNGTPVSTVPPTYPYPTSITGSLLTYRPGGISLSADDYYMVNIQTTQWFLAPNHTTFDETSSYIRVNGGNPNAILFTETINVNPNTYYLAGAWLIMITNSPNSCLIGFKALASDGVTQLFYGQTSNIIYSQWGQIGQIFNTKNNSQITLQVLSMSTAAGGNDFALDDVVLQAVDFGQSTSINKYVDKPVATIGDTLVYTSVISTNNTIQNIVFKDTIPIGASFVLGSVKVNGTPFGAYNPQTGFTLPNLGINSVSTVVFNVVTTSLPADNTIKNISSLNYNFVPIPGNTINNIIFSDTVPTLIEYAKLNTIKTVSENYGTLGDTLTFTITIVNNGNITATNVVFLDTIPNNTQFITDSVFINGSQVIGINPNPPTGFNLNDIPSNKITTVTFNVLVVTIPTTNPIINSAITNYKFTPSGQPILSNSSITNNTATTINSAYLSTYKLVNKVYANIGDILTYTIPISNNGNVTASNIIFIDTIPNGTNLIVNTLKQDGLSLSGSTNPPGISLPNSIKARGVSTVTFQVQIITIPNPNPIQNTASTKGSFIIDSSTIPNRIGTTNSNTNAVTTQVNNANLSSIVKYTNKTSADCGSIIDYTIIVPNIGNVTAQNVVFRDTLPNGTSLVLGSLIVDGVPIPNPNLSIGVTIPNIAAGATSTITFSVKITC